MAGKRRLSAVGAAVPPPAKVAKLAQQIETLKLDDNNSNEIDGCEMEGVEGENYTHLSTSEFNDAINEIEVDDRLMRLPQFIRSPARTEEDDENRRKALAVIPYAPRI